MAMLHQMNDRLTQNTDRSASGGLLVWPAAGAEKFASGALNTHFFEEKSHHRVSKTSKISRLRRESLKYLI